MRLWRLARSQYADLDGAGGLYAPSRWTSMGRPVIYCAETVAGAVLEVVAHLEVEFEDLPEYRLLGIDLPDTLSMRTIEISSLPPGWHTDAVISRASGDAWLAEGTSAALRVPSALAPHTFNVLLNPLHPEITGLRAATDEALDLDRRLI